MALRYVIVNGNQEPREVNYCTICCTPLGKSYLRDVDLGLLYHNQWCYETHVKDSHVSVGGTHATKVS